jgi:carotenoid cleavage dioxygenase
MKAMLDLHQQQTCMHRWRFNLRTGQTREHDLDDEMTEFPMVDGGCNGLAYRYSYNATSVNGFWLLNGLKKYDLATGTTQRWEAGPGVYVSEAPFARRDGGTDEDDGYLLSFLANLNTGKGECAIFDARDITPGPICRVVLPQQVPMGAHAFWASEADLKH